MREIKFRGKNQDTNEWVYGWYTKLTEGLRRFDAIISEGDVGLTRFYIHNQKTIGQYTGLKDKNGVEIYEGDVLKTYPIIALNYVGDTGFNVEVKWRVSSWISNGILGKTQSSISEVIGNIHDNPELLK